MLSSQHFKQANVKNMMACQPSFLESRKDSERLFVLQLMKFLHIFLYLFGQRISSLTQSQLRTAEIAVFVQRTLATFRISRMTNLSAKSDQIDM